jgi:solute carrier family 30 (zinc transporter), member 1
VADAFHMLNDVLSLCVGLWAVRVANTGSSKMYTYGWQRAETLGALVNGVFLVALCLSIFLEAIQRFVEPQVVSNPKLVLIVGCFGLASNIMGLFLFHDHSHGHGGEEEHSEAERGHSHSHEQTDRIKDQNGSIADVLPSVVVANASQSPQRYTASDEDTTTLSAQSSQTPQTPTRKSVSGSEGHRRRRASGSFGRGFGSVDHISVHPASFRNEIIAASRLEERDEESADEETALLEESGSPHTGRNGSTSKHSHDHANYGSTKRASRTYDHGGHNHNQPKDAGHDGHSHGGHGHSHGDLNMRGVFLHVLGDALGNIGVIITALIIWLTKFPGRYYFDPAVSLVITVIILASAIPLCKAASRILLQAVPMGMSIDEIRSDIESLDRVLEAHHVHVWQLSDTKLVASLHVKVDCPIEGVGSDSYMHLAREIRRCLHGYGIHSSTIQPEFTTAADNAALNAFVEEQAAGSGAVSPNTATASKAGSLRSDAGNRTCLLDCSDACADSKQCCPPGDAKK